MRILHHLGIWALLLAGCSGGAEEAAFSIRRGETRHLGRLTGSSVNPILDAGLRGTDLGVSFPCGNKLCFLFGDSMLIDPSEPGNGEYDSLAFGPLDWPGSVKGVRLEWLKDASGRFKPLEVPGLSLGTMDVPVEGIAIKNQVYVFFDSGWEIEEQRHRYSALALRVDPETWELSLLYRAPSEKFINISAELEEDGSPDPWLYLWGTGAFRNSPVYLARVRASQIADRSAYRYYGGTRPQGPVFGPGEEGAVPLFNQMGVGELSVARHEGLDQWLMAYNVSAKPSATAQIHLRMAPAPHGPWSDPMVIFKPWKDSGYTAFIHARRAHMGYDDGLSDPGREEEWGGPYGPYLIPSYFRSEEGVHVIVYTLSSWNPYQVHLMETMLLTPGYSKDRVPARAGSPGASSPLINGDFGAGDLAGWTVEGDGFYLMKDGEGGYRLTSRWTEAGDGKGAEGRVWQEFRVDPDATHLSFQIFEGQGAVKLLKDGEVLRRTFGPGASKGGMRARWNLTPLRGELLRLIIEDKYLDMRGFITLDGFKIEKD